MTTAVAACIIDPNFVRVIKKLKADFGLRNFVETGHLRRGDRRWP